MDFKMKLIFWGFLTAMLLSGCKSEVNSPERNDLTDEQASFKTVDSDLALMRDGGMPLDSAAGVFSIGWNEMFRPFDNNSEVRGMAFAVAFGERETDLLHLRRYGLDMGDVYINYSGNQIEMYKRFDDRLGTAYSLFEPPFGHCNSDNLLEFIPNTEYQFEVTGSDVFAPITISLTSPDALMDITSPSNGQVINPSQDLTIEWEGGSEGKVGVRLMPHIQPPQGRMQSGHGGSPPHHPPFDRVIFVILDTNTGTYTFTAQQIQEMLDGIEANGLIAEVSQMDFDEVEHENGTLNTAMRNGNSIMLRIQQ